MKLQKNKCPSCGGELNVTENSDEMKCEFCGSIVIIDDKATEFRRIKKAEINAKKEIDEYELENRKKNDNYNYEREYKKKKNASKLKGWSIALTIICLLFTFIAFRDGKILSGLIGIIQVAAFGYVTLLCLDVLPEKIKNLYKIIFIGGCILIIPFIAFVNIQTGGSLSNNEEKVENIDWNEYVLSKKLPKPKTLKGRLINDSSSSLFIYIMQVDRDEYKSYIAACKEKGYIIDISNSSNLFSAKNEEGYSLSLIYDEDDKEYSISLNKPKEEAKTDKTTENKEDEKSNLSTNNSLRSDFKQAMDDYESFMNEYVEFMKKYSLNSSDTLLLKDYSNYMEKYTKAIDSFKKIESENMNDAETKYYLEVQTRVNRKLLEVQ